MKKSILRNNIIILAVPLFIAVIGLTYSDNETTLRQGDRVSLNSELLIPAHSSHLIIQFGEIVKEIDLLPYQESCIVEVRDLGPFNIAPQQFEVVNVDYNEDMFSDAGAVVRYYNEIKLKGSETDILLKCQVLDDTMQHHIFPVKEIQKITGKYFTYPG